MKASRAGITNSSAARWTITPDDRIEQEIATMLRTTQNKIYAPMAADMTTKELEDGFPAKAEELFPFQGLIIGSVEANYFTPRSSSSSAISWTGAAAGCSSWAGAPRSPMAAGPARRWPT